MKIIQGKTRPKGLRIVIYGPEGIGKTTLAAKLPDNLFFDYEDGTHGIDVAKAADVPATFAAVKGALAELKRDHGGFRYVTIDTADKFENVLAASYSRDKNVEDIFAVNDYGRTVSAFRSEMAGVLNALSDLAQSGMNVVLLAHALQRKVEPLEGAGTYDTTELKLSKTVTPLVKEWADVIIFVAYKTFVVKNDDNKQKASGGKRWCFTVHTNEWTAKHRSCIELPDDCALDKMADILPKAIAAATKQLDNVQPCAPSPTKASAPASQESASPAVSAAVSSHDKPAAPGASEPAPAPADKPAVAELKKILGNYALTEKQIRDFAESQPKLKNRYGSDFSFETVALNDWPDEAVSWLSRNMEKISQKIKGN